MPTVFMVKTIHPKRGFTLIEVMVSLALFAIGILVLTQSFANGLWCKIKLSKENTRPLTLQIIRQELMTLPRDQVAASHLLSLPDPSTQVRWTGKVHFGKILHLYRVTVQIQNTKESIDFWIRRPDWMTASEKSAILSSSLNDATP